MMHLRSALAIAALCLFLSYTLLRLLCKLLRYKDTRNPQTFADVVNLLAAPTYELEVEAESQFQLDRGGTVDSIRKMKSNFSLESYIPEGVEQRTDAENLVLALSDSLFLKNLDEAALKALADALQAEERQSSGGLRCDCFYQSEAGIQQLFVLPSAHTAVKLKLDGQSSEFDVPTGCRVLLSPSHLACALLSLEPPPGAQFRCTLHGSLASPGGFWSITYAEVSRCLAAWPNSRRRLLQQFWSYVNDVLLLVFVEWLNLDALKFLEAAGFEELLARATDKLTEEQRELAGLEFSVMSFYERRPLYRRLALRLLCEIAECDARVHSGPAAESEVSVRFHPPGETVECQTAFLVLDGRLEAVTHPTLGRQFAEAWQPQVGRRRLPGCVGLMQYFSHSRLPFGLCSAAEGVTVAQLSDRLMDLVFGSPANGATAASVGAFESATRYLLRQLNPQVFRHDLLICHRRLHRGDSLVRRGEPAETVKIIVSGRLRHRAAELGRGDCVGLVETLILSGESCWSRDVVAVRESRAVSVPQELARAWVSQNHRLLILERVLGALCQRELDTQQQQQQRNDRSDDDDDDDDDDCDQADEEDEETTEEADNGSWRAATSAGNHWRRRPRRRREEALIGFVMEPSRFNQAVLLLLLRRCLRSVHGAAARLLSEADAQEHFGRPADQLPDAALRSWLEEQELSYPTLVLVCSERITRWTRLVLGYLDCLIVCCDADASGDAGEEPGDSEMYYSQMYGCRVHLAVFHPLTLCPVPQGTSRRFLRRRHWWTRRVFHVRCCTRHYKVPPGTAPSTAPTVEDEPPAPAYNSDLARLVRLATGRAIGLAFGNGGGPHGIGNLGALEALLGQEVAVDLVSGSGLGSLTAAAWALHHRDLRATREAVERLWSTVDSPLARLRDVTLPLVSAFTGARLNSALRRLLGTHRQAEDLWLPCVPVSTDLVAARSVAHTSGTLWRAVRASCGRVGAFPPVWEPRTGRLLVDGAHTDRLPARALRRLLGARRVVAVALDDRRRLRRGSYLVYGDGVSGWRELLRALNPFRLTPLAPSAADIQAALTNLAGGEALEDDRGGGGQEPPRWCPTVRPDDSFSAARDCEGPAIAVERWRGYWAARRRLRRMEPEQRADLHGWID